MIEFFSPLRYPGGKGKIADYFKTIFKSNGLCDGVYIEPYVGGGSVALSLLFNEYVDQIIINDKDRSIYAFWFSILNHTKEFCDKIQQVPVNMETWKEQKDIQKQKESIDLLSLGFSTFFLNRTNRSGILNAGVIGGNNQSGNYKIDARFNKKDLVSRITKIGQYKDAITLHNEDACELVYKLKDELPQNCLFYFDPPYYVKGQGLYMNYYDDQDHIDIANTISLIENQRWVVTYDFVPFISNLYKRYRSNKFELNYSASNVGKGNELMVFSDNLIIPEHSLFTHKDTVALNI